MQFIRYVPLVKQHGGCVVVECPQTLLPLLATCPGIDQLVAYGSPAQERWMDRNLGPLDIPVGIGVGGVLNFPSGRVPRAPGWVRRLELEWFHRLVVQPWRWRRQAAAWRRATPDRW